MGPLSPHDDPVDEDLSRFLLSLMRSTQADSLWDSLVHRLASYGFDQVLYAATRFRTRNGVGDLRDALVLTNYPETFTKAYLGDGLFRNAPMVRWAMDNVGSLSWSRIARDAAAGSLSPAIMRVIEFNRRHGIVAGYGISFPRISSRAAHGIGLSSSMLSQAEVDELWRVRGTEIELICHTANLTLVSLPYGSHGRRLTDRQREVLELVSDGKTVEDVAQILSRTSATIEKHLRLARAALDVETTAQAIMKANAQNQFFHYEV